MYHNFDVTIAQCGAFLGVNKMSNLLVGIILLLHYIFNHFGQLKLQNIILKCVMFPLYFNLTIFYFYFRVVVL